MGLTGYIVMDAMDDGMKLILYRVVLRWFCVSKIEIGPRNLRLLGLESILVAECSSLPSGRSEAPVIFVDSDAQPYTLSCDRKKDPLIC